MSTRVGATRAEVRGLLGDLLAGLRFWSKWRYFFATQQIQEGPGPALRSGPEDGRPYPGWISNCSKWCFQ